MSGKKARQQRRADRAGEDSQHHPVLWINSCPVLGPDGEPVCLLTWGPLEWVASTTAVEKAARDLLICAAYSDMLTGLLKRRMDPQLAIHTVTGYLRSRPDVKTEFGSPDTLTIEIGGDSKRGQGLVILRHGAMAGRVLPHEAHDMAAGWIKAATTSVIDRNVAEALRETWGMPHEEIESVLAWMRHLSSDADQDFETFMIERNARLNRPGLTPDDPA